MSKKSNKSKGQNKENLRDTRNGRGKDFKDSDYSPKRGNSRQRNYRDDSISKTKWVGDSAMNDISWWNKVPSLFNEATKVSFMNQLGAEVNIPGLESPVPGALVMDTFTTPGWSSDINSAASLAAVGMYEEIRKRLNKPNPDYEPADLAIMVFCISDIYSQYMNIIRAFGMMNVWSASNFYLPRALMQALYGGDNALDVFQNFLSTGPQMRFRFNAYVAEANSFLEVPGNLDIITRQSWLFQYLYRDSNSAKAQIFARRKQIAYIWDDTGETGSKASVIGLEGVAYSQSNPILLLINTFGRCIEALRNSSSVRIMLSDMRQAFADSLHFNMPVLDEEYTVEIRTVDEVNMQIENTLIYPVTSTQSSQLHDFDVTQNPETGAIIYQPSIIVNGTGESFANRSWYLNDTYVINVHEPSVSADQIMEATRSIPIADVYDEDTGRLYFRPCTDFCSGIRIVNDPDGFALGPFYDTRVHDMDARTPDVYSELVSLLSNFDWAPALPGVFRFQDMDNYAVVNGEQLNMLNVAALFSAWNVREQGHYMV
nr:putative capsid [Marmot picobirnavirus]